MATTAKELIPIAAKVSSAASDFHSKKFRTIRFSRADTKNLLSLLEFLTRANRIIAEDIEYISEALTYSTERDANNDRS